MFPPNLQKNIQELERQISLLETECEHMETEKQENTLTGKQIVRELPNQPFITGPSPCACSYSSKMTNLSPTVPKMYSTSCAHFRMTNPRVVALKYPEDVRANRSVSFTESDKTEETCGEIPTKPSTPENEKQLEKNELIVDKHPTERESKKSCNRSIGSIKEVSESSEENFPVHVHKTKSTQKNNSKETSSQPWCELLREQSPSSKRPERNKNNQNNQPLPVHMSEPKLSSDEESKREIIGGKSRSMSGNWLLEYGRPPSSRSSKRRSRSVRTKKNDEVPMDLKMTKALLEKETQCVLWNEDKEKDEFYSGLNESIKILHCLIGELKTKLSREKREDVLNDMQNTLLKLSRIKSKSPTQNPLITVSNLKESGLTLTENEENIIDVKHTLLALKQFCQELSDEKVALTEEIAVKTRAVANFKNKEKEYLSLISSLKFNLEKMKDEADEGAHAKRDLKILKIKLQEETKVIEALKKSHEKMQELIENYVLENDKLRAQVKIAKLESQKYNVLLAGKEADIHKYKKEIESFQKQITEQLSLLRSKATENEVEQTIEAISNQRHIIQTEVDSFRSQLDTLDGDDFNENLEDILTETSATRKNEKKASSHSQDQLNGKTEWESQSNSTGEGEKRQEGSPKSEDFTPVESETETHPTKRKFGLERVLSSSKNLRSSINELLEDIRRESSEIYWLSPSNSCVTSSQSALLSTTSDDVSEADQNN